MTKISLSLDKSVHENASIYFDKAKKAKKKIDGAMIALEKSKKKLTKLEKEGPGKLEEVKMKTQVKREWYEKFRWFYSSNEMLVIGGRDATTNEIVIKKYTDKEDVVCHTDMAGSPFFIIKADGKEISEKTIQEAINATASFSRAWKKGLSTTSTFYVKPDQVTKEANAGEALPKGAFMIRGKTNYMTPKMEVCVGVYEGKIMSGSRTAIEKHCEKFVVIIQGQKKASDVAKEIKKLLEFNDLDEIIRGLPPGECKILEVVVN